MHLVSGKKVDSGNNSKYFLHGKGWKNLVRKECLLKNMFLMFTFDDETCMFCMAILTIPRKICSFDWPPYHLSDHTFGHTPPPIEFIDPLVELTFKGLELQATLAQSHTIEETPYLVSDINYSLIIFVD